MSLPLEPCTETHALPRRLPLVLKLGYTAFMAVLVPVYWANYGPTNFLYFCDVALLLTLVAVWTESALLAGMAAVGILLPQLIWVADFAAGLVGVKLLGMTDYMFDERRSIFLRGLSLFHGWLPFLLLFLVKRLGYDKRAFPAWWVLAWALMLFCYFFMPGPTPNAGTTPVNINYVHGMSDTAPQTWMPPLAWLGTLLVGLPAILYWPTHLGLKKYFGVPATCENSRDIPSSGSQQTTRKVNPPACPGAHPAAVRRSL